MHNSGKQVGYPSLERFLTIAEPVTYFVANGVNFGMKAKAAGVVEPYESKGWEQVPSGLKGLPFILEPAGCSSGFVASRCYRN